MVRVTTVLAVVVLVAVGCASVETGPPANVAGEWAGRCSDCPVRAFTLIMTQEGERLSGTLQASGRSGLGERPMSLRDGKLAGRTITFQAVGADGIPLDVRLELGGDGRSLAGQGKHRAPFGLTFTRAK